jgi:hypothetical protein
MLKKTKVKKQKLKLKNRQKNSKTQLNTFESFKKPKNEE